MMIGSPLLAARRFIDRSPPSRHMVATVLLPVVHGPRPAVCLCPTSVMATGLPSVGSPAQGRPNRVYAIDRGCGRLHAMHPRHGLRSVCGPTSKIRMAAIASKGGNAARMRFCVRAARARTIARACLARASC